MTFEHHGRIPYRAQVRLGTEATQALVLACSDRRFRAPTAEFLERGLGVESYDLVAMPGGPYTIAVGEALPQQLKVGMRMLRFLMRSHVPPQIVLISHQDCGRYLESFVSWLRRPGFSLAERQHHDLQSASKDLGAAFPAAAVSAYYARIVDGGVVEFEPV